MGEGHHNRKNKKKTQMNPDQHPDTVAARSVFPPSSINPDQPPKSHRNKNPNIADQPRSQQGKKKKKNPDQNPDTAAARSTFPPSLINPDQPPKSHRNKNPDTADQPRSHRKKKKTHINPIKTQTLPPLSPLDVSSIVDQPRSTFPPL